MNQSEILLSSGLCLAGAGLYILYIQAKKMLELKREDLVVVRHGGGGRVPISTRFCVIAARTALDSLYLWTSSRRKDFIKAVNDANALEQSLKETHALGTGTLNDVQRAQFVAFLATVVQSHRRQWAGGRANPVQLFMEKQVTIAQDAVKVQINK